jgi:hypothetical protein
MGIPAAPSRSGLTKGGEQTHVQAATAEIFLDPAVARFPRSLAAVSPSRAASGHEWLPGIQRQPLAQEAAPDIGPCEAHRL